VGKFRRLRGRPPEFYLSVLAILVSGLSLWLSYAASPLSQATKPRLVFGSSWMKGWNQGKETCVRIAIVRNESDFAAEQVTISVGTGQFRVTNFNPSRDIEYSVIDSAENWKLYNIPVFPPHYQWGVMMWLEDGADDCAKHFGGPNCPRIDSVRLKDGVAQNILDIERLAAKWTPP